MYMYMYIHICIHTHRWHSCVCVYIHIHTYAIVETCVVFPVLGGIGIITPFSHDMSARSWTYRYGGGASMELMEAWVWWGMKRLGDDTVDGFEILHHLGWLRAYWQSDELSINWCRILQPSTVGMASHNNIRNDWGEVHPEVPAISSYLDVRWHHDGTHCARVPCFATSYPLDGPVLEPGSHRLWKFFCYCW